MELFFKIINFLDDVLWSYVALYTILALGIYFTLKSRFYQIKVLMNARFYFKDLINDAKKNKAGIHPFKLYCTSLGGMVGIGNLVAVMSTVTIGGPGSLVWIWIASFIGMILKYCEIYLSISFRKANAHYGYDGGPMYYLQEAFGNKWVPIIFCVLICIYGAEVSQFLIIADTFTNVLSVDKRLIVAALLIIVILSSIGGVKRLANICALLLPPFIAVYILVGLYILVLNYDKLPALFLDIMQSAFTGHAAVGGFVGSTALLAAHYGVSRAVYSGDIGIGYDAIVLSESKTTLPEKQARMAIFALFADTTICTVSLLIVMLTGVWTRSDLLLSEYIIEALSGIVPYNEIFVAMLFFIAGITTIIGYIVVGRKCAHFLNAQYGKNLYMLYAIAAFIFFSFQGQDSVMLLMSVSGGLLLVINLTGLFKLRKYIKFP